MFQRIYSSSFQEQSQSPLQEKLKCDVSECESLIKKKEETEKIVKKTIENQMKSLKSLKKNHNVSPSYHTLEYVEEIFCDSLDSFEEKITKKIQDECKAVGEKQQANQSIEGKQQDCHQNGKSWRTEIWRSSEKVNKCNHLWSDGERQLSKNNFQKWVTDIVTELMQVLQLKFLRG